MGLDIPTLIKVSILILDWTKFLKWAGNKTITKDNDFFYNLYLLVKTKQITKLKAEHKNTQFL